MGWTRSDSTMAGVRLTLRVDAVSAESQHPASHLCLSRSAFLASNYHLCVTDTLGHVCCLFINQFPSSRTSVFPSHSEVTSTNCK